MDVKILHSALIFSVSLCRSRWRRSSELCLARSLKKELNRIHGAPATVTTVHLATVSPRADRPYLSPRCQPGVTRMRTRCSNEVTHWHVDLCLFFKWWWHTGFFFERCPFSFKYRSETSLHNLMFFEMVYVDFIENILYVNMISLSLFLSVQSVCGDEHILRVL